eukprot:222292-Rhodomonas_salina.3
MLARAAKAVLLVGRHLFALYVAAQGLGVEAQFLKDFLGLQYKLSTSQIPQRQTSVKLDKLPYATDLLSPSGGFGPVADDGYGVSYMMADDARTFFHVSSKRSAGPRARPACLGCFKEMQDYVCLVSLSLS